MNKNKTVHEEGYAAGLSADDHNPYPKNTNKYIEWQKGFEEGLGDWSDSLNSYYEE